MSQGPLPRQGVTSITISLNNDCCHLNRLTWTVESNLNDNSVHRRGSPSIALIHLGANCIYRSNSQFHDPIIVWYFRKLGYKRNENEYRATLA